MNKISVNNLELILNNLLDKLRKNNVHELSFEYDWYWNVPTDQLCNSPAEPGLTVGSLNDDIDFLNTLVEEDYTTEFLELERLATLFKFMSMKYSE